MSYASNSTSAVTLFCTSITGSRILILASRSSHVSLGSGTAAALVSLTGFCEVSSPMPPNYTDKGERDIEGESNEDAELK